MIVVLSMQTYWALAGGKKVPPTLGEPDTVETPIEYNGQGLEFRPVDYYTTKAEREIIKKAGRLAYETMHSQCASDFLMQRKLIQTEGWSNARVIAHLKSLKGVVPVSMYYRKRTSAVAYRTPPYKDIYLNRKAFHPAMPLCEWAATLAHEGYGHAYGEYDHAYKWNPQRDFSVPYSIGGSSIHNKDVFQVCCKEPQ